MYYEIFEFIFKILDIQIIKDIPWLSNTIELKITFFSFEIAIHIIVWWTIGIKKLKKAEETYL